MPGDDRLGYVFRDRELLLKALTHRSYAHEHPLEALGDNERLEFLGDALLGFLVADWLVRHEPEADEGDLTLRKQSVVRTEALDAAARRIDLGQALRLGRGEEASGGRAKASILAAAFEAVLGAVYLDGGLRSARSFAVRHLGGILRETPGAVKGVEDFKTRLQEVVQARLRKTPAYRLVEARGPDHRKEFVAEVLLDGEPLAAGSGPTRKQAEQVAAAKALLLWEEKAYKNGLGSRDGGK